MWIVANNYRFQDRFRHIFSNLFTILSRVDISKEQVSSNIKPILKFLQAENNLGWTDIKELSIFIEKNGSLFEISDLTEFLKIAINRHKYGNIKYIDLIERIPRTIKRLFPDFKFANVQLVTLCSIKTISETGNHADYNHLLDLYNICNDNCRALLMNTFEAYLDKKFNVNLYEGLLRECKYDYTTKNYFTQYIEYTNNNRIRAYKFGEDGISDLVFMSYVDTIYMCNIDFSKEEFQMFSKLTDFEKWILSPEDFNYENFNPRWLIDLKDSVILDRLKTNQRIAEAIEKELQREFHPILAELKYTTFGIKKMELLEA